MGLLARMGAAEQQRRGGQAVPPRARSGDGAIVRNELTQGCSGWGEPRNRVTTRRVLVNPARVRYIAEHADGCTILDFGGDRVHVAAPFDEVAAQLRGSWARCETPSAAA
jgi:hypothetical protein